MRKLMFLFALWLPFSLSAQDCSLVTGKDQFTKEEIKSGGYQAVYTAGLFNASYVNIALAKKGSKYILGYQWKFYSQSKDDKQYDILTGSKVMFRFDNDVVIDAVYRGKDKPANVTYDSTFGQFAYVYEAEFEISEEDFNSIPDAKTTAFRFDTGVSSIDYDVKEKFKQSKPQEYLAKTAGCIRL